MKLWYCLGGPLHGTYRPAGPSPILVRPPSSQASYYYNGTPVPTVVIPHPPVTYYPMRMLLPGWRVQATVYVDESMVAGRPIPPGAVLPGGVQGDHLVSETACRWCYRPAFGQMAICVRDECISAMAWLETVDAWGRAA